MTAKDGCIFCRIAGKEIPARIVFENDKILAFEDIKPQAPTHILIISRDHIDKVSDLTDSNSRIAGDMVMAANAIASKYGLKESGYRLVLNCGKDAGQDVFHIHTHLLGGRKFAWPPG